MKHNLINELRNNKTFRLEAILTFVLLLLFLILFSKFLNFVENRPGFAFDDPLLKLFSPVNITWLIFSMIYGGIIFAVFILFNEPERFLSALKSYVILLILRMISMYLLPLNPPADMILLKDPFVETFASSGQVLTKDLFFSGHTSLMFLIFLIVNKKYQKYIFLIATIVVGFCVLAQHVHYTVDVAAAPVFAYASYKAALWINSKIL